VAPARQRPLRARHRLFDVLLCEPATVAAMCARKAQYIRRIGADMLCAFAALDVPSLECIQLRILPLAPCLPRPRLLCRKTGHVVTTGLFHGSNCDLANRNSVRFNDGNLQSYFI
jgi:hypothetical protein